MYKKFFSYAGIEGFAKGLNWLTIALLPLFLPTDQYGIVGLLVAIEGIMNTVLTLGQGRAILRHTVTFKEKNATICPATKYIICTGCFSCMHSHFIFPGRYNGNQLLPSLFSPVHKFINL